MAGVVFVGGGDSARVREREGERRARGESEIQGEEGKARGSVGRRRGVARRAAKQEVASGLSGARHASPLPTGRGRRRAARGFAVVGWATSWASDGGAKLGRFVAPGKLGFSLSLSLFFCFLLFLQL